MPLIPAIARSKPGRGGSVSAALARAAGEGDLRAWCSAVVTALLFGGHGEAHLAAGGGAPQATEPGAVHVTHDAVKTAVYGAVADLNETLPPGGKVPLSGTVEIFAAIDSLAALNFLLRVEQRLSEATGNACDLMDGDLYEQTLFRSPTLDELADGIYASLGTSPA